jgi:SpoU rRNA methylase family enzyme
MHIIMHMNQKPKSPKSLAKTKSHRPSLSTSMMVRNYVIRYPSVVECLRKGIINHSKLARLIQREHPKAQITALIAAVRRLAIRSLGKTNSDAALDKVFEHSRLTAQGGVSLVICASLKDISLITMLKEKALEQGELFLFMEGILNFTIVTSQTYLTFVKKAFKKSIKASYENLALLSVSLPYSSVHTHGVSARLTGLLAASGIPILQEMTSGGEYFIVLATRDLTAAIEVLEWRRRVG